MYIFIFQKSGVRTPVRVDQSVHTEIAVMDSLSVIASIVIDVSAVFRLSFIDGMVTPFPDKSSAHHIIILYPCKIVFQISRTIAHGMGIFHHQKRFVRVRLHIVSDVLHRRIHTAVNVNIGIVKSAAFICVQGAFIVSQSSRIKGFGPSERLFKGASIGTFISHGPDDDGGPVFIPVDASAGPVHGGLRKVRVVRDPLVPEMPLSLPGGVFQILGLGSMAFIVRLIHDKESVFIAQFIEIRHIGVVAAAYGIEIMLFDHLQISLHLCQSDCGTGDRI